MSQSMAKVRLILTAIRYKEQDRLNVDNNGFTLDY